MTSTLPFSVNRNDARSLLDQVADGLRTAIVGGFYKPGEELPSSRELCPMLGVSRIVTSAALERLVAEGYILTRRGLRPAVRDRATRQWLGHVVFVCPELDAGPFQTAMAEALRTRLNKAGFLFTRATVEGDGAEGGKYDFSLLDAALARSVDLAIVLYNRPAIFRHLQHRGVPFAVVADLDKPVAGAVGLVRADYESAIPEFVAACVASGVRRAIQFRLSGILCDAVPALRAAGIAAKSVSMKPESAKGWYVASEEAGLSGVMRYTASHKFEKGDLVFFSSDHMARGGLLALASLGLSAPDDIGIATWANSGLGPVYFRDLSRMEMDPARSGATVAEAALEFIRTGVFPAGASFGPKWHAGETMSSRPLVPRPSQNPLFP